MKRQISPIWRQLLVTGIIGFLLSLTAPSIHLAQTRASDQVSSGPPHPELMKLYVSVLDKDNNFVSKLNYFDFEVACDKTPQSISYFSKKDDPLGIVFLLDISGSMRQGGIYKKLLPYLLRFIEQGHPQNEYSIIGFNNQVGLNLSWTRNQQEVVKGLSDIGSIPPQGQTALYEAIRLGIDQVSGRSSARGAIILISDGVDTISATKLSEIQKALLQNNVPVYSILFNLNFSTLGVWTGPDPNDLYAQRFLSNLTVITGGSLLLPRNLKELELGINHLVQELRHQYIIGFQPSCNHQGNKPHQVRVKIAAKSSLVASRKTIQIRHREEYK